MGIKLLKAIFLESEKIFNPLYLQVASLLTTQKVRIKSLKYYVIPLGEKTP